MSKTPKPGEIYRHYKGNEYRVLGLSYTTEIYALNFPSFTARDADDLHPFDVYQISDRAFTMGLHPKEKKADILYVIYQDLNDNTKVWARKLHKFIDTVSWLKIPRFKLIGHESTTMG